MLPVSRRAARKQRQVWVCYIWIVTHWKPQSRPVTSPPPPLSSNWSSTLYDILLVGGTCVFFSSESFVISLGDWIWTEASGPLCPVYGLVCLAFSSCFITTLAPGSLLFSTQLQPWQNRGYLLCLGFWPRRSSSVTEEDLCGWNINLIPICLKTSLCLSLKNTF